MRAFADLSRLSRLVAPGVVMMAVAARRRRFASCQESPPVSVGCYNLLCPTYAVKWREREGVAEDGSSNWLARWAVMQDILRRARWDVVCLQEVEYTEVASIMHGLGPEYCAFYFKHAKRPPDGVMIAVRRAVFDSQYAPAERQYRGAVFGRVDLVHTASGARVRVVTSHCRGKDPEQLTCLASFADDSCEADITVVTGDFNEDFAVESGSDVRSPLPESPMGRYITLRRTPELKHSRPSHKQGADQKSGKGKIDYIFVRGTQPRCSVEVFRDDASDVAMRESHAPCAPTGEWPSDHGAEALSFRICWASARL